MRMLTLAIALGAVAALSGPTRAQDPPAGGHADGAADLGRHLLVASEAKLAEGKALLAAGRTEAGLAALREVGALLARHEALVTGHTPGPAAAPTARPSLGAPAADARTAAAAVADALRWLAQHQSEHGGWSSAGFQAGCRKNVCDGRGAGEEHDVGVTALATLAFLGSGSTPTSGPHAATVARALARLRAVQTPDGCVGPKLGNGHYMYGHAMATVVLAEAYGLTQGPLLRAPAQRAVDFLLTAQNPYLGWRYGVRPGDNDTSVTAWCVVALKAATLAGLKVSPEGFAGAKQWLDRVTDDTSARTGYVRAGDHGARLPEAVAYRPTEAMTAAALAARLFMGARREDPVVQGGAKRLQAQLPAWDPAQGNDFYYWYYGTLAMFQLGGEHWRAWGPTVRRTLLDTQRRGGDELGSWDPRSAWGVAGGRVYATAVNTLSLEICARTREAHDPRD